MPISSYQTPGIFVQEVSSGARPIQPVGTSTAAFLGVAPDATARLNQAVFIDSPSKFTRIFSGADNPVSTHLSLAVAAFFANGGSACYVLNLGKDGSLAGNDRPKSGLRLLETIDDVSLVAAPGYYSAEAYDAILTHCERMGDRFAILDGPPVDANTDLDQFKQVATVPIPAPDGGPVPGKPQADTEAPAGLRPRGSEKGFGACYVPWLVVPDPYGKVDPVTRDYPRVSAPPSGHIAGIYARADATTGVHKAPANEIVNNALGLTYSFTSSEQAILNPLGINCIRRFNDAILVWGARTNSTDASWRYINVRRLFLMVESSIARSTRWIVFEPNDEPLWKRVRFNVDAFLTRVFRDGALMGRTPEEAFFVKCDRETNPPEDIDAGVVNIVIGIAPVKPAEFVVFQIGQRATGSSVTSL